MLTQLMTRRWWRTSLNHGLGRRGLGPESPMMSTVPIVPQTHLPAHWAPPCSPPLFPLANLEQLLRQGRTLLCCAYGSGVIGNVTDAPPHHPICLGHAEDGGGKCGSGLEECGRSINTAEHRCMFPTPSPHNPHLKMWTTWGSGLQ